MAEVDNIKNSYLIHIRSKDCEQQIPNLTTDFQFILNPPITIDQEDYLTCQCVYAEIPYSFYNTNSNNNYFYITEYDTTDYTGTAYSRHFSLTSGSYSVYELRDEVKSQLNTNNHYSSSTTYDVTYNIITNKMTISMSAGTRSAIINFTVSNNMSIQLGFKEQNYSLNPSNTIVSDNVCNMSNVHAIYVKSNMSSSKVYNTRGNHNNSSILQKIQIDSNSLNMIYSTPTDASYKSKLEQKTIDRIELRLTDQRDRLIDLNGLHFEMTLQFNEHHATHYLTEKERYRLRRSVSQLGFSNPSQIPLQPQIQEPQPEQVVPSSNTMIQPVPHNNPTITQDKNPDIIDKNDAEDQLTDLIVRTQMEEFMRGVKDELGI